MRGAAEPAGPVTPDEAAALLDPVFTAYGRLILAVSGGSDSMALMHLAAGRLRQAGAGAPALKVVTVDHGLRPGSAAEAGFVVGAANALGLELAVERWQGPIPATGIQEAARTARYRLLAGHAGPDGAVVTAHTAGDQAETVLMNLSRGSGIDGLAGIARHGRVAGVAVVRPLLDLTRDRLVATLEAAGATWIEDPSNLDDRFERVRVRKLLAGPAAPGLDSAALLRTARRAARARAALEAAAQALEAACVEHDAVGYARAGLDRLLQAPDELGVRLVSRLALDYGGGDGPVSLAGAERVWDWLRQGGGRAMTLAGCRFARRKHWLIAGREAGRIREAPRLIETPVATVWDGRFLIAAEAQAQGARLMALQDAPDGLRPSRPREVPDFVWRGLPVLVGRHGAVKLAQTAGAIRSLRHKGPVHHAG